MANIETRLATQIANVETRLETRIANVETIITSLKTKFDEYIQVSYKNKSFAEDLTEGKFLFPIIHSINANNGDSRLLNILRQKPSDVNVKSY